MATVYGKYSFEILDPTGKPLIDLSGLAEDRELSFVRNDTYTASFSLDLNEFEKRCRRVEVEPRSILGIGINILRVKRLGEQIFTGVIENLDSDIDENGAKLEVKVISWLGVFKYRFTDELVQHTNKTYGQIMWDTINTSQSLTNGSWGVTQGVDETTDLRDKKHEYKNIKDALIDITNLEDGPDIEFTSERVFNTYNPMGKVRSEFEFTFPGNIKSFKVNTDTTDMANYVLTRGQGIPPITDIQQDTDSQALYRLRQYILDKSDVLDPDTLTKHGLGWLNSHSQPIELLELTIDGNKKPYFNSYWLGDSVKTIINNYRLFDQINDFYRIDEINLKIDNDDGEEIQLKTTRA